jgi:hypothetical protein
MGQFYERRWKVLHHITFVFPPTFGELLSSENTITSNNCTLAEVTLRRGIKQWIRSISVVGILPE